MTRASRFLIGLVTCVTTHGALASVARISHDRMHELRSAFASRSVKGKDDNEEAGRIDPCPLGGEIGSPQDWAFPYLDDDHRRYATGLLAGAVVIR